MPPKPSDDLLTKLCGNGTETYRYAQSLLRRAQAKTGPGSGHDVGVHSTGLPAICSYLASQKLRNNEVSETVAQKASCLKPRDFQRILAVVRSVLFNDDQAPEETAHISPRRTPKSSKKNSNLVRPVLADQESPTKKRRVATSSPPRPQPGPSTPRRHSHERRSPQAPVDIASDDADQTGGGHDEEISPTGADVEQRSSDGDDEEYHPRRFRPVFLDHKQWYRRDPRLEQEWGRVEARVG